MEKQTKNIQIEEIDQFLKQSIESWNLKNKNNLAFAFLTRKIQYIFLHFIDVDKKYYFELLSEGRIKFSNKNQENLSQLTIQLSMQTFHSLFSRKLHPCMAYIQKDVSVTGVPLADIGLLLPIYCELISQYKIEAEIVSKLNKPPIKQNFSEILLSLLLKIPYQMLRMHIKILKCFRCKNKAIRLETWSRHLFESWSKGYSSQDKIQPLPSNNYDIFLPIQQPLQIIKNYHEHDELIEKLFEEKLKTKEQAKEEIKEQEFIDKTSSTLDSKEKESDVPQILRQDFDLSSTKENIVLNVSSSEERKQPQKQLPLDATSNYTIESRQSNQEQMTDTHYTVPSIQEKQKEESWNDDTVVSIYSSNAEVIDKKEEFWNDDTEMSTYSDVKVVDKVSVPEEITPSEEITPFRKSWEEEEEKITVVDLVEEAELKIKESEQYENIVTEAIIDVEKKIQTRRLTKKDYPKEREQSLPETYSWQSWNNNIFERIYQNAIRILERTGCRVQDEQACKVLAEYGCSVDKRNQVVKYSQNIIENALFSLRKEYYPQEIPYMIGTCKARIWDYELKVSREGSQEDVKSAIDIFNRMPYVSVASAGILPFDIPKQATDIFNVAMLCKYSCKKFTQRIYTLESAQLILEIFQILGASLLDRTQEMQYVFSASAPLCYKKNSLQLGELWVQKHLPIFLVASTIPGITHPQSMEGILSLTTAEWLAGLVYLSSLGYEETVFLQASLSMNLPDYTIRCSPFHLGIAQALREIADQLGFPSFIPGGSNVSWGDFQTGWEKSVSETWSWLQNNVYAGIAGALGEDFCFEQVLLDNWCAGMLETLQHKKMKKIFKEINLNEIKNFVYATTPYSSPRLENLYELHKNYIPTMESAHKYYKQLQHNPQSLLSQSQEQEIDKILQIRYKQLGA
ncbi:MAG TPA: trimethylamine methyltransferase family protein [Planctomycetota bacterium]|nr:trimethylamine methyltransferase family protein [Planctomycetota bacterium]